MKKNTRNSVFETNSSSTHSIHVDKETKIRDKSLIPDEDGTITLDGDEFGWEWARYNDAITKANYAAIETSGVVRDVLEQAIKEQTGAKKVVYNFYTNYGAENDSRRWAYIDHQSSGLIRDKINVNSVEQVKNWIFNPNCWLITGNDNSETPINIKDFPWTDEKGITHPYDYTHKFKIPGINKEIFFNGKENEEMFLEYISEICSWDTEFDSKGNLMIFDPTRVVKENSYKFDDWIGPKSLKLINLKSKNFILIDTDSLNTDAEKECLSFQGINLKNNVIREKHKPVKNQWELKEKVRHKLLVHNLSKYTIKKNFVIEKMNEEEKEKVSDKFNFHERLSNYVNG